MAPVASIDRAASASAELYRRRRRERPDPELRWLAECPACGRKVTGRTRDIVATVLAGHHYYVHGVRLTEAEQAAAIDELIPERELMEQKPNHKELPLK